MTKSFSAIFLFLMLSYFVPAAVFPRNGQEAVDDVNPGVVIEEVKTDSFAARAGLKPGDVVLSWVREDAAGKVLSPFDLTEVEVGQGPRGPVVLKGLRGSEEMSWTVASEPWDVRTRPNFAGHLLELQRQNAAATDLLNWKREAAGRPGTVTGRNPGDWVTAWLLLQSAESLVHEKQWDKADEACQSALQQLKISSVPTALALKRCADLFLAANDFAKPDRYYQEALTASQAENPAGLRTAAILSSWGRLAYSWDDLRNAEDRTNRAIKLQRQLAPGSFALALSISRLGVYLQNSDLYRSAELLEESLAIRKDLIPGTTLLATNFENLANTYVMRGDLEKAEPYLKRALELWEKLSPDSLLYAGCLIDMANAATDEGDWTRAELLLRRAMAIQQKLRTSKKPGPQALNNLALILQHRGQTAEAEEMFRQALAEVAPGSLEAAAYLENLGEISRDRGNLDEAEKCMKQALAIQEKLIPRSLEVAVANNGLADVYMLRGNLSAAEEHSRKALEVEEALAPHSQQKIDTLKMLGDIYWKKGDLSRAEEKYRTIINLQERLMLAANYTRALLALADLKLEAGELDQAQELFARGFAALEAQTARLGGAEDIRSGFRARFDRYYRDYIGLLIRQGRPEFAFQVLERSRARSLLEMLAEARVDVHQGIDPALLEAEHRLQGEIAAKANRRLSLLAGEHTEIQVAALTKEIEALVARYQDVAGQIRISSPAYAALMQPAMIDAKEIQTKVLDSNTLLLEYLLGEQKSYVFAVAPDSLQTYELPKRAVLEKAAREVYSLLTARNRKVPGETSEKKHLRLASAARQYPAAVAELSRMLLGPLASQLPGKRLLIVSDGVLSYIPFSLLVEPGARKSAVPLVVNHEIVNLPSASVLAVLRQQQINRKPPQKAVAVLADPVFDRHDPRMTGVPSETPGIQESIASASSDSTRLLTRSVADVGLGRNGELQFRRLLFTRKEANQILAVTPEGAGMKAVDFDASRATAVSPELAQYRIVHFATHGLLDSVHPELSGLVFSMVDKSGRPQNGFLELQDIYNLNLPVDLVVLSACETGLGKEISGEGLIGLTRGFMHAGASRVVASLWKVSDRGTATLMATFYKAMEKDGMAPAAALRAAQLRMLRQKRWNAPYYWAAFQLQGEWK